MMLRRFAGRLFRLSDKLSTASSEGHSMWARNAFTERLNLKWPILQAPMGWLSTPALAAAVSNAGGLGGSECGEFRPRMPNVALLVSGNKVAAA